MSILGYCARMLFAGIVHQVPIPGASVTHASGALNVHSRVLFSSLESHGILWTIPLDLPTHGISRGNGIRMGSS